MPKFGVYKAVDGYTAGDEVSSTYEGRHVTVLESEITHPSHTDGFVDGGDPVVIGKVVGVAFKSAVAATDLIAVDTEGIWGLSVVGSDDAGNSAVAGGDLLYINTTTCILSKIATPATQIPFGYALGVVGDGATGIIAVKVHFDPATLKGDFIAGQRFTVSKESFVLADVAKGFWIAPHACKVIEALEAHGTVSSATGTLNVEKCNTGQAAGAGGVVLATGWNMTSTANVPVTLAAVATAVANLIDGDELRLILTAATGTSYADGVVTVVLEWT